MASIFRPRRGKQATAESQNFVLAKGEIFFEVPTGGVGKGIGRIKMGDGTTAYSSLPYFLQQNSVDVDDSTIAFTESTTTANATLLNEIASGAKLKVIVGSVKKLLRNLDTSVTKLNNDLDNYLPLSGGTMTGDITSQNISPETGSTNNCGSVSNPFASVCSNGFYAIGSDALSYAQVKATTLGTETIQGYSDILVGNGIANGTAGNAKGRVIVYGSGANYAVIQDHDSATAVHTLTLPRVSGQIPVVAVSGTTLSITY